MKLYETIPFLLEGKKIRCGSWIEKTEHIYLKNGILFDEKGEEIAENFLKDNIFNNYNNWEVYEEYYSYSTEEIEIMKALKVLGLLFLAREKNGDLRAYENKPERRCSYWVNGLSNFCIENKDLPNVKWEDLEPLDISKELERIGELK